MWITRAGLQASDPGRQFKGTHNLKTPWMYESVVMIKSILHKEMDQFLPHRFAIGRFIGVEAEWFADQVGNIVGTIAEGTTNSHWGYAVLRRDVNGVYQLWDLKTGIESCDAARIQIVHAMEATQTSGQNCSPQVG